MAEDKKSFLLYVDQRKTVDQLPDEIAGKLFKLIYSYCDDDCPEVEDLLLRVAFEPIKQLEVWLEKNAQEEGLNLLKAQARDLYKSLVD